LQYRASNDEVYNAFAKASVPTTIDYYTVDSLDLKVRVQHVTAEGNEVNLVFFHGSPSSNYAWHRYLKDSSLGIAANMHAIDRPGYGYSNFGKSMPSLEKQGEVMSALLEHYDLKNVIAVGTSYGGPVAARLAAINSRVKGVVMISPAIDPKNEKRIWQSDFTQFFLTRWLVPTGYRVAGDEKTVHAAELAKIEKDWDNVRVPVIHIHGDADDIVPYINVEYSEKVFKNIEIITVPDAGHEIAWRRSDVVIPYLLKMIQRIR